MTEQVQTLAPEALNSTIPQDTPPPPPQVRTLPKPLYASIKTFNAEGKTIGERVVDMHHVGTARWLTNHHWWAMHQPTTHTVEVNQASDEEIGAYMFNQELALKAKYSKNKH